MAWVGDKLMNRSRRRSLTFAVAALFAGAISHAEPTKNLFEMSLGELLALEVVTVKKRTQGAAETPASVAVLTRADLDLLGFGTLQDAMEYLVGFNAVAGENNIWHGYSIRGNTVVNYNTTTLLLVDGLRIYNPLFGSFDLSAIPIASIERVEIIKGARSVSYGTNAVNAVINVITREVDGDMAQVTARVGQRNTAYVGAEVHRALSKDWQLSAFAELYDSDGDSILMASEQGEQIRFERYQRQNAALVTLRRGDLELSAQYHDRSLPTYLTRSFADRRETEVTATNLGLVYRPRFGARWRGEFVLSRYDWDADRDFFDQRAGADPAALLTPADYQSAPFRQIYYNSESTDGVAELHWAPGGGRHLTVGAMISEIHGRRFQSSQDAYDIGAFRDVTDELSLYVHGNAEVSDSLNAYLGLRNYRVEYRWTGDDQASDYNNTSYESALVWRVNGADYLKLVYGQSFRIPTYFEKDANTTSTVGNPLLRPETSETLDLVYAHTSEGQQLELTAFRAWEDNRIERGTAADGRRQNQNLGESRITGLEASWRADWSAQGVYAFATLGLYDGEGRIGDDQDLQSLPFTFDHMVTAGLRYRIHSDWTLTASAKRMAEWGDAPDYLVVNAGLRFQRHRAWSAQLDVHNIGNETVLLPEVSRGDENVTTFPRSFDRRLLLGLRFHF